MPQAFATVGPGDGPNLERWPLLAWTEALGVITEDKQIPVQSISDEALGRSPEETAEALGTTPEHVSQALDYLTSN